MSEEQLEYSAKLLANNISLEKEIEKLNNIINGTDEILKEHINECREELNTIMKGNDLDYINECSIQFNVIRDNIEMIMEKINKLKGSENDDL